MCAFKVIAGNNREGCTGREKSWVKNKSWVMKKCGRKKDLGYNRTSGPIELLHEVGQLAFDEHQKAAGFAKRESLVNWAGAVQ